MQHTLKNYADAKTIFTNVSFVIYAFSMQNSMSRLNASVAVVFRFVRVAADSVDSTTRRDANILCNILDITRGTNENSLRAKTLFIYNSDITEVFRLYNSMVTTAALL